MPRATSDVRFREDNSRIQGCEIQEERGEKRIETDYATSKNTAILEALKQRKIETDYQVFTIRALRDAS